MRYVLTNEQMREEDGFAMAESSPDAVMERAGKAVFEHISKRSGSVLIVCGSGNNGGDGFVCARYLLQKGRDVCVLCRSEKYSELSALNKERYLSLGGKIVTEFPKKVDVIVDGLLGTGFLGKLRENIVEQIQEINRLKENGSYVYSIDIPSGVNGDNGLGEIAVEADETLCIGEWKRGNLLQNGLGYGGKLSLLDVGIHARVSKDLEQEYVALIEQEDVKKLLPKRFRNSHKGSYGKVAIVAGSKEYTGAGYLAMKSASKSGVGYTTLFTPKGIAERFYLKVPEALIVSINGGGSVEFCESDFEKICEYDTVVYGMGMGISEDTYKGAKYLIEHYKGKLILDADGLNSIARFGELSDFHHSSDLELLITPHLKEFERLIQVPMEKIKENPFRYTRKICRLYDIRILLKGASTVLADGKVPYLNVTGTTALAKGGSGDVLAGLIGGLCTQGLSVFDGAKVGSYLLGRSAELATVKWTEYVSTPTDCIDCFGEAFRECLSENADE